MDREDGQGRWTGKVDREGGQGRWTGKMDCKEMDREDGL